MHSTKDVWVWVRLTLPCKLISQKWHYSVCEGQKVTHKNQFSSQVSWSIWSTGWFCTLEGNNETLGVFTWTRITFRKTFRNVIQNVIGIVIWTTCVYMGYKRLSNHDQELRTASDILLLLRSPRALIDPCAYAWLQRAFLKCTRTNHVPKQLCVYMD